jgi:hypothetical protein
MIVHHLDHDLPAKVQLSRQIDPAHAALLQESDGFIPAQEDTADHAAS